MEERDIEERCGVLDSYSWGAPTPLLRFSNNLICSIAYEWAFSYLHLYVLLSVRCEHLARPLCCHLRAIMHRMNGYRVWIWTSLLFSPCPEWKCFALPRSQRVVLSKTKAGARFACGQGNWWWCRWEGIEEAHAVFVGGGRTKKTLWLLFCCCFFAERGLRKARKRG